MIESIAIKDVATYGNVAEQMSLLSKLNFIYGANGSGKTTISRVIADETRFPACTVNWKGGARLQTLVYNRDFVAANFNQTNDLKGIFTLGQQDIETLNKIVAEKSAHDELGKEIQKLSATLQGENGTSGKKGELASLEEEFKVKCWAQKQNHDEKFAGAFEGYRNNSEKFKAKVLQEAASNSASLESLDFLDTRAKVVFGPVQSAELAVAKLDGSKLVAHEAALILAKRVLGKEDVDIAAMIKRLGNSDWVREGRSYFEVNDGVCPFCQQDTTDQFAKSLNDYFDETFVADSKAIDSLATDYTTDANTVRQGILSIITAPSKFIDVEKLKAEKELFDSIVTINQQRLASKIKEPSKIVELESVANVVASISALITAANTQVAEHNKMVANHSKEKAKLTAQVWRYLLDVELSADLSAYDKKKDALSKAIKGIADSITSKTSEKNTKAAEIRALEKQTTSIQPTIDGINGLLSSFGFKGFSLAKAANGSSYRLVRGNGADAQETLSEGEKTFVTFLYFYHLLKGSNTETGVTTDRIVVLDDPVSSLDSDVLFLVSSLIKRLFDEIRANVGYVRQIFVLTHNVYFHKEVTFNPARQRNALKDETFWIVRKSELQSRVERHDANPITTSYDLLWEEVRRPQKSKLTIQNTLRRILENYFKILGGVDPDKICDKFDGKDKVICKSLFSWVNDGSHFANDDLYVSIDDGMVETYLTVFKAIFDKTEHFAHYKMMMGTAYVEAPVEELAA